MVVKEGGRKTREYEIEGGVRLKYGGGGKRESTNVFSLAETYAPLTFKERSVPLLRQSLRPSRLGQLWWSVNRVPESSRGPNRANCWLETRRPTANPANAKIA